MAMKRAKSQAGAERDITAATARWAAAFDRLIETIRACPDPQRAFDHANELAAAERALQGRIAELRAQQAHRIWQTEEISLAELGKRIGGVSKQRALKMLQTAQPQPPEENCGDE